MFMKVCMSFIRIVGVHISVPYNTRTNSLNDIHSLEAGSRSANQKKFRPLRIPATESYPEPDESIPHPTPYFLKVHLSINPSSVRNCPKWFPPFQSLD